MNPRPDLARLIFGILAVCCALLIINELVTR